jgi:hypothetical protein
MHVFPLSITPEKKTMTRLHAFTSGIFLEHLETYPALPAPLVQHLGKLYQLSSTHNAEIRFRFYGLALADPTSAAARAFAPDAIQWVVGEDGTGIVKGRMKFCRPILRAASKVDLDAAVVAYKRNRASFHPIAQKAVDKVSFGFFFGRCVVVGGLTGELFFFFLGPWVGVMSSHGMKVKHKRRMYW